MGRVRDDPGRQTGCACGEGTRPRHGGGAVGSPITGTSCGTWGGAEAAPDRPADVWLVRYDPRIVQVAIRRGENGGRTLPHKNVVRELVKLGVWTGPAQSYAIPTNGAPDLATAVLIQAGPGGAVLAAARG